MTAQPFCLALAAAVCEIRVQRIKTLECGNRHQKVAPRITDKPLNLAFVITFAWTAKPVSEQVMRLQFTEHARALTTTIAENASNRDLGVVVEDRLRHATEEIEGFDVAVAERLGCLRRIGHHKSCIRMRQMDRQKMDLAQWAIDLGQRLAKISLCVSWRMRELTSGPGPGRYS